MYPCNTPAPAMERARLAWRRLGGWWEYKAPSPGGGHSAGGQMGDGGGCCGLLWEICSDTPSYGNSTRTHTCNPHTNLFVCQSVLQQNTQLIFRSAGQVVLASTVAVGGICVSAEPIPKQSRSVCWSALVLAQAASRRGIPASGPACVLLVHLHRPSLTGVCVLSCPAVQEFCLRLALIRLMSSGSLASRSFSWASHASRA